MRWSWFILIVILIKVCFLIGFNSCIQVCGMSGNIFCYICWFVFIECGRWWPQLCSSEVQSESKEPQRICIREPHDDKSCICYFQIEWQSSWTDTFNGFLSSCALFSFFNHFMVLIVFSSQSLLFSFCSLTAKEIAWCTRSQWWEWEERTSFSLFRVTGRHSKTWPKSSSGENHQTF